MKSIILTTPFVMALYAIALILSVIGIKKKTGVILSSVSIIICLLTSGYAFLKGATIFEVVIVLLVFLIVNLMIFTQRGE